MKHFSEADLLETYYTQPGESMPVMMHLADCSECAARYANLDRKLRQVAADESAPPETFWEKQRDAIARRIRDERASRFGGIGRLAAAAMLLLVFAGVVAWQRLGHAPDAVTLSATTSVSAPTAALPQPEPEDLAATTSDPWETDALDEYQSIVAWESWDDDTTPGES